MFGKQSAKEKSFDVWGVDMAEKGFSEMKRVVNDLAWKTYFEPWFKAQIDFRRAKMDEIATLAELQGLQHEIKWLKRLSNMREDFNSNG